MSQTGPIVLVDDDPDDQEMIERIIKKMDLKNEIRHFSNGEQVFEYLKTTKENPFIVICDINMPIINGIELKTLIDKDPVLKLKSIPFVFLSTAANPEQVGEAYKLSVQGFFLKGQSYDVLKNSLKRIIEYWQACVHPNNL
jgi:DNA-binding NarL/FixJ family response regulator